MESYWAKIENGVVVHVEVVEDSFVAANPGRYSGTWKKVGTETQPFVGKGFVLLEAKNKIIEPAPYESWLLDEEKLEWNAPALKPGENYQWDESLQEWQKIIKITDVNK